MADTVVRRARTLVGRLKPCGKMAHKWRGLSESWTVSYIRSGGMSPIDTKMEIEDEWNARGSTASGDVDEVIVS